MAALHQGYLRGLRDARSARLVTGAEVQRIERTGTGWRLESPAGRFAGAILVDAAGAWADELVRLAGVRPIGLLPKRRTAILVDPPEGQSPDRWP